MLWIIIFCRLVFWDSNSNYSLWTLVTIFFFLFFSIFFSQFFQFLFSPWPEWVLCLRSANLRDTKLLKSCLYKNGIFVKELIQENILLNDELLKSFFIYASHQNQCCFNLQIVDSWPLHTVNVFPCQPKAVWRSSWMKLSSQKFCRRHFMIVSVIKQDTIRLTSTVSELRRPRRLWKSGLPSTFWKKRLFFNFVI